MNNEQSIFPIMTNRKTIADLTFNHVTLGCYPNENYLINFRKYNSELVNLKIIPNTYNFDLFIEDEGYSIEFTIRVTQYNNSLISLIDRINNIVKNSLDVHSMLLLKFEKINDYYFEIVTERIPF